MSDEAPSSGWFHVPNSLIDQIAPEVGPTALMVYLILLRHARGGIACVSHKVIAEAAGITDRGVRKVLARLAEAGLIAVESNRFNGAANTYRLLLTVKRSEPPFLPGRNGEAEVGTPVPTQDGTQRPTGTEPPFLPGRNGETDSCAQSKGIESKTVKTKQDNSNNGAREAAAVAVVVAPETQSRHDRKPNPWEVLVAETSREEVAEARQAIIDSVAAGNEITSPVAWARARIYGEREKASLMPTGAARASPWKPTPEQLAEEAERSSRELDRAIAAEEERKARLARFDAKFMPPTATTTAAQERATAPSPSRVTAQEAPT